MHDKYCLPIIKQNKQEIIATIQQQREVFAYFEVWLDYIDKLDHAFVQALVTLLGSRLILVFRRQNLEPIAMPVAERINLLKLLDATSVMVDLDYESQADELTYITAHNLQLTIICSYHNYKTTPDNDVLQQIVAHMTHYRPTIFKLATFCNTPQDAVRLLGLLLSLRKDDKRCIILGMGEHGVATRIFGTQWGNEVIFVPETQAHASAPGQLTRQQLDQIAEILKG